MLRRLRLRRLRLLPPPDLLPLPSRALVCAGAICVNFAISFASVSSYGINLTNPMMLPGGWAAIRGEWGSSHAQKTRMNPDEFEGWGAILGPLLFAAQAPTVRYWPFGFRDEPTGCSRPPAPVERGRTT